MVVAVCVFELHLPVARSLKEKRRVVKGLVERIHHRYRVSIAETDLQELHQRAEIGMAAVHSSAPALESQLDSIRQLVESTADALVVRWDTSYVDPEADR